ncbi:hypothetical protein D3C79_949560 [compost metagenome]
MPGEQPLQNERLLIGAGGIEQQLRQAFGSRGGATFLVQPQAPRQRRAHRADIQLLTLDGG